MNAAGIIHDLVQQGVRLEAADGRLRWWAPPGVVTDEVLQQLRDHKAEVLAFLASGAPSGVDEARALAAAWRGAARELGELAGFPRLPYRAGHAVAPGAANWGVFVGRASVPELRLVVASLRGTLASTPRPGDE